MDSTGPDDTASLLPLHEQLRFTDGACVAFATALVERYGDQLRSVVLIVEDPRYAATLDYPADARISAHCFCLDQHEFAVDAEGRRPVAELVRAFGVRKGYKHHIVEKPVCAGMDPDTCDHVRAQALLDTCGWPAEAIQIPRADGALQRNFMWARQALRESLREERRRSAEARVRELTPEIPAGS